MTWCEQYRLETLCTHNLFLDGAAPPQHALIFENLEDKLYLD
jgi:hypothetical protein